MLSTVSMALMPREQESFRPSIWMYNGLGNLLGNDKGGNLDLERGSSYTLSLFFYKRWGKTSLVHHALEKLPHRSTILSGLRECNPEGFVHENG